MRLYEFPVRGTPKQTLEQFSAYRTFSLDVKYKLFCFLEDKILPRQEIRKSRTGLLAKYIESEQAPLRVQVGLLPTPVHQIDCLHMCLVYRPLKLSLSNNRNSLTTRMRTNTKISLIVMKH
jgi:hypothetical protein